MNKVIFKEEHSQTAEKYAKDHWIGVESHLAWPHHKKRLEFAALNCIGRVLDVGCANGRATQMMKEIRPDCQFEGVEPTEFLFNIAKKERPDIKFYRAFGEDLPFKTGSYDTVVCMGTIEHVQDHIALARELSRVAKSRVVVGTPNVDGVDPDHKRVISEEELCAILSEWWSDVQVVGRAKIPYLKEGDDYVVLAQGRKAWKTDMQTVDLSARPRIFITTKCSYACETCSLGLNLRQGVLKESTPQEWIDTINDLNPSVMHITGGEPGIYQGLAEVVNSVNGSCKIFTNLSVIDEFLKIQKQATIKAAYYPGQAVWSDFRNKILQLRDIGLGVFVYLPEWLLSAQPARVISDELRSLGIEFCLDSNCYEELSLEYSTLNSEALKRVVCKHPWTILGPDRKRYPCVSKMLRGIEGSEDIRISGTKLECFEYGKCTCCDIECARFYPV